MINNINIIILVIITILLIFLCKYKEFFQTSATEPFNLVIKKYKHFINRVFYNSSCTTDNILGNVEIVNNDMSDCVNKCINNDSCKSISVKKTQCNLHSEMCDSYNNNNNNNNTENSEYIYNINHNKNINTEIVNLLEIEFKETDTDNSLTLVSDIIDNIINKYNNSVIKLYDIIKNNTLVSYNNSLDIIHILAPCAFITIKYILL